MPPELHRFLLGLMSPARFCDWLYASPDALERWLSVDDYLAVLELDYTSREAVATLRKRLGSQYVPIAPKSDASDTASLIGAILAAPDDSSNYLVLGDELQQKGDPRGQLIALQAGLPRRPSYFVSEAEANLLRTHRSALLGDAALCLEIGLYLEWFFGFVSRAVVSFPNGKAGRNAVRTLFGHPSFELLREIVLQRGYDREELQTAMRELQGVAPSRLSVLRIGDEDNAHYFDLGDLSGLWSAHPRLRVLELNGFFELGQTALPDLVALTIRGQTASIFEMEWPSLERLELHVEYFDHPSTKRGRAGLSQLRHLVLRGGEEDGTWTLLASDPLLAQLSTLEVNLCQLGVRVLCDDPRRFQHLEILDLHAITEVRPSELAKIRQTLPRARIR